VREQIAIEHSAQGSRNWPIQIQALLLAHVLLLLGSTWLCSNLHPTSWLASIAGSVFVAQACLIGVWLGVRRSSVLWRWGVAAIGVGLIAAASGFAQRLGVSSLTVLITFSLALIAVFTTMTAILLLIARKSYHAVLISDWRAEQGQTEGFQFGVRHLLIVTFAVAMLLGLRGAASHLLRESEAVAGPILVMLFFGVALGVPCLVVLWATLGTKRPHERVVVAMVFVLLVAMLTPLYFGEDWQEQGFWRMALPIVPMFAVIIVSLLVVRSAGYRLVQNVE
jgi:hypothetical protein